MNRQLNEAIANDSKLAKMADELVKTAAALPSKADQAKAISYLSGMVTMFTMALPDIPMCMVDDVWDWLWKQVENRKGKKMTNKEIIASIKAKEAFGIDALASKYGITIEQAERIAETIAKRKTTSIRKVKGCTDGFDILVCWRGYGLLGSFTTHTRFCFSSDGRLYGAYGE